MIYLRSKQAQRSAQGIKAKGGRELAYPERVTTDLALRTRGIYCDRRVRYVVSQLTADEWRACSRERAETLIENATLRADRCGGETPQRAKAEVEDLRWPDPAPPTILRRSGCDCRNCAARGLVRWATNRTNRARCRPAPRATDLLHRAAHRIRRRCSGRSTGSGRRKHDGPFRSVGRPRHRI